MDGWIDVFIYPSIYIYIYLYTYLSDNDIVCFKALGYQSSLQYTEGSNCFCRIHTEIKSIV
jgi:hypothetical protein